jgi:glycosyltransferase involved in cell wall biosynthesis
VHKYKHQWTVVEAVAQLRKKGLHVALELIGPPASGSARLSAALAKFDPTGAFVTYRPGVAYEQLHNLYAEADVGLFASSCENLPNILLENMASGLPIACSRKGPMPEVLGEYGEYFEPEDADDIAAALARLISSAELRQKYSTQSFDAAEKYTWEKCATETFGFLARTMGGSARSRSAQ